MRVRVATTGLYTYPDVTIVCGQREIEDDTLLNPHVIFEVLSDSTEAYDRGDKFEHYRTLPSFKEYVLVSQHKVHVDHFVKQPDGSWLMRSLGPRRQSRSLPWGARCRWTRCTGRCWSCLGEGVGLDVHAPPGRGGAWTSSPTRVSTP